MSTSSTNTRLIIGFQIFTRILTFFMNNVIARKSSAAHLGLLGLKLDFLATTMSSLSREGIRTALLRRRRSNKFPEAAWISSALSLIVGSVACWIILSFTREPEILNVFPQFKLALLLYFLASVMESFADTAQILLIKEERFKEKVIIESSALSLKVAFILTLVTQQSDDKPLIRLLGVFSKAQIIYSISLNLLYCWRAGLPKFPKPSSDFISLSWALTKQNVFKYFLAQGDLLVIGAFASLQDQGVYTVVSNYGSLLLRFLMQPIEEASLQYFSQELNGKRSNSSKDKKVSAYFSMMLKTMFYLALFMMTFGSFFTKPLVQMLLGTKWAHETEAPAALSAYCFLVGVAAISGFIESFLNAVIDDKWLTRQKWISIVSSAFYCCMAITLILRSGSVGLIVASAANFLLRAASNAFIVNEYATKKFKMTSIWSDSSVSPSILIAFLACFVVNFVVRNFFLAFRIAMAFCALSTLMVLIYHKERYGFLIKLRNYWFK